MSSFDTFFWHVTLQVLYLEFETGHLALAFDKSFHPQNFYVLEIFCFGISFLDLKLQDEPSRACCVILTFFESFSPCL